ncbi:hypothetical protein CEXT_183831 [Caerostris extrusa]|uniref:Ribosomal protein L15 n=1 Tax=Caerostris extrusa TaxID=172846 RepID=A0AAV4MGA2_CAEEX|nr:hypothetical protein CEXT_183831 [Caerostris extrusa]
MDDNGRLRIFLIENFIEEAWHVPNPKARQLKNCLARKHLVSKCTRPYAYVHIIQITATEGRRRKKNNNNDLAGF